MGYEFMARIRSLFLTLDLLFLIQALGPAKLQATKTNDTGDNLVINGVMVCLDMGLEEISCVEKKNWIALKDEKGRLYPLKPHEVVDTLLIEKRLNAQSFRLTIKKLPGLNQYELVKSQFFRDGKLYDFYYYCEICNITTYAPGLCMCCRQETEYREKAVSP